MRATAMTSIVAHDSIIGAKAKHHAVILNYVKSMTNRGVHALSRREMAKALGIETASMSARCNELLHMGHLVEVGIKDCGVTGRTVGALALPMLECG